MGKTASDSRLYPRSKYTQKDVADALEEINTGVKYENYFNFLGMRFVLDNNNKESLSSTILIH